MRLDTELGELRLDLWLPQDLGDGRVEFSDDESGVPFGAISANQAPVLRFGTPPSPTVGPSEPRSWIIFNT